MEWNETQEQFRDAIRGRCAALSEGHVERDKRAEFDPDKWRLIAASGLLGLPFDERFGGLGQDLVTTMGVLEELGYGCRDGGLSFSVTTHMVSTGVPLQRFGSDELQERFMPSICRGSLMGAHAISEPDSGSDALNMRTTARLEDGQWILRGSKTFVSSAPMADVYVVYARTDAAAGPLGITAFLIERDRPGLRLGEPIEKMGLKTSPMAQLFFDDCAVPPANIIGHSGSGFLILDHVMRWEILCSFIVSVGEMQHRLERCMDYASTRRQFGKPISAFQAVSNKIVEMKIGVETARLWLYRTAQKLMDKKDVAIDIAISKLLASEANLSSAINAVQVFGGNGYMTEYGLEKDLRNAVGGTIYSGTSDIQRNRIARMMKLQGA
jgi:alkylation response protein AidB-like acyl-CoA dehydrogenase